MRITINIETGDLGMKAGLAVTNREGNTFNVLIDTSRLTSTMDVHFIAAHEFGHIMALLREEEKQAKNERFTKAVNHIVDDTLGGKRKRALIPAIEVNIGDRIDVPGDKIHVVTGMEVHTKPGDGLLDGDVRLKWANGSMIFRYDTTVWKVLR